MQERLLQARHQSLYAPPLKRALESIKRATYSVKKALYAIKRALYLIKRAVYSKRTSYSIKRAVYWTYYSLNRRDSCQPGANTFVHLHSKEPYIPSKKAHIRSREALHSIEKDLYSIKRALYLRYYDGETLRKEKSRIFEKTPIFDQKSPVFDISSWRASSKRAQYPIKRALYLTY